MNSNDDLMLKSALWYREKMDFSVIPINHKKIPMLKTWEQYQKEKPTKELITEWWTGEYAGANIGIVTGAISCLTVVDVDKKDGTLAGFEAIEAITPDNLITPTATSPSGGEHRYFIYHEGTRNRTQFIKDCDLRAEGGYIVAPPSHNGRGSYTWKADLKISQVPLSQVPSSYIKALNTSVYEVEVNGEVPPGHKRIHLTTNDHKIIKGTRDDALFHVANHLVRGKMPIPEVHDILKVLASNGCEVPYPQGDISTKITSVINRQTKQTQNVSDDVRELVMTTSGYFTTTNVHNWLQMTTRREKKSVNQSLLRMVDEGLIERTGTKSGTYQLMENDCEAINWRTVEKVDLDIRYPLGVERFFVTMPKNIILVAGSPDSGKTALLLNMVHHNMKRHKVWYFSSEMGSLELRNRLEQFDTPLEEWDFEARERATNFHRVIRPDDINIIDFLEVSDNFFQVGKFITDIHNTLNNGIAVIALQKKRGERLGRGAEFSEEKARLYMTVDSEFPGAMLRIRKCKNWRDPMVPPTGHAQKFKIVGGCKLIPEGDWYREDE
jgi:hypothetical protein